MTYYGFRCYSREGVSMGWFYTAVQDQELNWIDDPEFFFWCKRWKTEKGAKKNFDYYNNRWHYTKGGYLQIEIMPEVEETTNCTNQEHGDTIKYDPNIPIWFIRLTPEILAWLEKERVMGNDLKQETDSALIIRKLEKLRRLECQDTIEDREQ